MGSSEETIKTEDGPFLLNVGDAVAFPKSGWLGTVSKVTDAGIRLEFIEWFAGTPNHEEVWSWEKVFAWPSDDFKVFGDGYYLSAAVSEVNREVDRQLEREGESR